MTTPRERLALLSHHDRWYARLDEDMQELFEAAGSVVNVSSALPEPENLAMRVAINRLRAAWAVIDAAHGDGFTIVDEAIADAAGQPGPTNCREDSNCG